LPKKGFFDFFKKSKIKIVVLFIPKQLGLGLVVRPMKSFAFMQGFFDLIPS
jgi:hypothetical protein